MEGFKILLIIGLVVLVGMQLVPDNNQTTTLSEEDSEWKQLTKTGTGSSPVSVSGLTSLYVDYSNIGDLELTGDFDLIGNMTSIQAMVFDTAGCEE